MFCKLSASTANFSFYRNKVFPGTMCRGKNHVFTLGFPARVRKKGSLACENVRSASLQYCPLSLSPNTVHNIPRSVKKWWQAPPLSLDMFMQGKYEVRRPVEVPEVVSTKCQHRIRPSFNSLPPPPPPPGRTKGRHQWPHSIRSVGRIHGSTVTGPTKRPECFAASPDHSGTVNAPQTSRRHKVAPSALYQPEFGRKHLKKTLITASKEQCVQASRHCNFRMSRYASRFKNTYL